MKHALLLAAVLAAPAGAQSVRLGRDAGADGTMRRFLETDATLRARLEEVSAREEAPADVDRPTDLRDSVSDTSRAEALSHLPGFPTPSTCKTLAGCATPELATDVSKAQDLPDSLTRLIRPWLLLQQARGKTLNLTTVTGEGDEVLSLTLRSFDGPALSIHAAPLTAGGYKVWFDQPLLLAGLYNQARELALAASR